MGRRDHPHIGLDGLAAPDPVELALLQHPQQLDLHRQRHIADFVEEEGAPLGQFEAAAPGGNGTGEGPLLVTEQLALEQLRRNGAAVDGHEGARASGGQLVDGASHHLLAGSGLTEDQYVGVGLGHLADETAHLLDAPPLAHQQAQQGLTLVVGLMTGMQGDEGLAEVQMTGEGLIGKGRLGHPDEVAATMARRHQGEEGQTRMGGKQLTQGALAQFPGQNPLQGPGSLDGHIEIALHHLLPGDPHEGEHSPQLLAPHIIGINKQHTHSHPIHIFTPDAKLLFFKCLLKPISHCVIRGTKCQNSGGLSKLVASSRTLAGRGSRFQPD